MQWIPCEELAGTLGACEGHCAVCLPVEDTEWILCLGGYCDGELRGDLIASDAQALPALRWETIHRAEWLECDGATVTRIGDAAYLFGGLDANLNRSNTLMRLALRPGNTVPLLEAEEVETLGDVPPPRARHSAGGTTDSNGNFLFIFAGETDAEEQTNDAYRLDLSTRQWTRVKWASKVPQPRLLAGPLLFVSNDLCVLYGGAHFVAGDIASLCDVWACRFSSCEWTPLTSKESVFPRSNGHAGGVLKGSGGTALFIGGKDAAEGCDRVKCITWDNTTNDFQLSILDPQGSGPHWRYTPALVETLQGLLLLGGQCRHPHDVVAFFLSTNVKE